MEGAGFLGTSDGSSHSSASWGSSHNNDSWLGGGGGGHSHHNNNPNLFVPGLIAGGLGGAALGHLFGSNQPRYGTVPPTPVIVPPPAPGGFPQNYAQQYPQQPYPHEIHIRSVHEAPRRSKLSERISQFTCCLLVFIFIGLLIVAWKIPQDGNSEIVIVGGDRKLLTPDSYWLKEIEFSGSSEVRAYLFERKPRLAEVLRFPHMTISPQLSGESFHYLRFDLFPGSTVLTQWDFPNYNIPPHFVIIRSTMGFESWKLGNTVYGSILHEQQGARGQYDFTAPAFGKIDDPDASTEYYFVFYSGSRREHASGTVSFDVAARTFSLQGAIAVCPPFVSSSKTEVNSTSICSFTLSQGRQSYVVLAAPVGMRSFTVAYSTIARSTILGSIISALPVVITVLGVLSCLTCCGCLNWLFNWIADCMQASNTSRGYQPIPETPYPSTMPSAPYNPHAPSAPVLDGPYNPNFPQNSNQPTYQHSPPPYSETDHSQYRH